MPVSTPPGSLMDMASGEHPPSPGASAAPAGEKLQELGGAPFGAVWDLDGTLVDTEASHYAAWRALLQEHQRDLSYEVFRPTFGLRNDDVLVQHLGFQHEVERIAALSERKEELFRASLEGEGLRMQPGARELVEHLHALGARQAIASSAPPRNIELIVRLMGLGHCFDAVVSSEEVTRGKPAPDIVLRAAERLGLPASRLVVLEDAPAGVAAGKAAGCRVVAIEAAFPAESLAAADLVVQSFLEVLWPRERWEAFLAR
jgi:HAD superfamily hydrolase (TIGR01509 family)